MKIEIVTMFFDEHGEVTYASHSEVEHPFEEIITEVEKRLPNLVGGACKDIIKFLIDHPEVRVTLDDPTSMATPDIDKVKVELRVTDFIPFGSIIRNKICPSVIGEVIQDRGETLECNLTKSDLDKTWLESEMVVDADGYECIFYPGSVGAAVVSDLLNYLPVGPLL